jgi:hypothetical protein
MDQQGSTSPSGTWERRPIQPMGARFPDRSGLPGHGPDHGAQNLRGQPPTEGQGGRSEVKRTAANLRQSLTFIGPSATRLNVRQARR